MAFNVRLPEDLDRRLEEVAAQEHTSKTALLQQGVQLVIERANRRAQLHEGLEFVTSHDAELLDRLKDA